MASAMIHPAAQIAPGVRIGDGCVIGADVIIGPLHEGQPCDIEIGEHCTIHDHVRIQVATLRMKRDCKLHHHVTLTAGHIFIGNNLWVGQYSHLDGTGWLGVEDDVTIGYNCYVWTHSHRSGLPEGSKLITEAPVELRDRVWLMGCNVVVNPGVLMREGSVALANAVVTHSTEANEIYAGVPAKKIGRTAWNSVLY